MKKESVIPQKRMFFWNMFGSIANALSSFLLLTIVTRVNGSNDGGTFSLAFSTAQLLALVGCFDSRSIQVADVKKKAQFRDYLSFRILTIFVMMVLLVCYLGFTGKTGTVAALFFFITVYKAADCAADIFEGLFQQENRIDLSGMFLGIRVICSSAAFTLVLVTTHNLLYASISMCIVSAITFLTMDLPYGKKYADMRLRFHLKTFESLLFACIPLFLANFLMSYMLNTSKFAIDRYMTATAQNYYGFLSMPAFSINMCSIFFFRPMMCPLAISWNQQDRDHFMKIMKGIVGWIGFLTAGAVIGAYFLGIPVLNLISGLDLNAYRMELVVIMIGGGLSALNSALSFVITVWRKQKWIMISNAVGCLTAVVICPWMVQHFGIMGAALSYSISMLITIVIYFVVGIHVIQNAEWNHKDAQ